VCAAEDYFVFARSFNMIVIILYRAKGLGVGLIGEQLIEVRQRGARNPGRERGF
jgi:hypothetical protein